MPVSIISCALKLCHSQNGALYIVMCQRRSLTRVILVGMPWMFSIEMSLTAVGMLWFSSLSSDSNRKSWYLSLTNDSSYYP